MPKQSKAERINHFIMRGAQEAANKWMCEYLSKNNMGLDGVSDFDAAMDAITKLAMHAFAAGVNATLEATR